MHAFPKAEELSFFVNETLAMISIAQYTMSFAFDDGANITSEYLVEFIDRTGRPAPHNIQKQLEPDSVTFHQCIGKKVLAVNVSELRLKLHFEDGSILQFETELGPYECGQIADGRDRFIVF